MYNIYVEEKRKKDIEKKRQKEQVLVKKQRHQEVS